MADGKWQMGERRWRSVGEDAIETAGAGGVGIDEGDGIAGAWERRGEGEPLNVREGVFVLEGVMSAS
jgi:hypothetical protein